MNSVKVNIICPKCGHRRLIDSSLRGLETLCLSCFESITIPGDFSQAFLETMQQRLRSHESSQTTNSTDPRRKEQTAREETSGQQADFQKQKEAKQRAQEETQRKEEQAKRAEDSNRQQRAHNESRTEDNSKHNNNSRDACFNITDDDIHFGKVLGLKGRVSFADIKLIYKEMAMQYHPDKVSHLGPKLRHLAELEMKLINEAYAHFKKKLDKA